MFIYINFNNLSKAEKMNIKIQFIFPKCYQNLKFTFVLIILISLQRLMIEFKKNLIVLIDSNDYDNIEKNRLRCDSSFILTYLMAQKKKQAIKLFLIFSQYENIICSIKIQVFNKLLRKLSELNFFLKFVHTIKFPYKVQRNVSVSFIQNVR